MTPEPKNLGDAIRRFNQAADRLDALYYGLCIAQHIMLPAVLVIIIGLGIGHAIAEHMETISGLGRGH